MTTPQTTSIKDIADSARTIVCLGPGGVGKTTTSAALAISAAEAGRQVCVVTIDPAKRLASALGLDELSNSPKRIRLSERSKGSLHALMLDAGQTFDDMIANYAKSQDQVKEIKSNTIYQNLTANLSGTQEYMAMERLWELHQDDRFDLIIVDTPPSVGALDFLHAPARLVSFLDNKVFGLLIKPAPLYLKPVSIATKTLLRTISKVVGSEVVADAVDFFQAFSGIEEGFKNRANEIQQLLMSDDTKYIAVTAPKSSTLEETAELLKRLSASNYRASLVVVNRLSPDFDDSESEHPKFTRGELVHYEEELVQNYQLLRKIRASELTNITQYLDRLQNLPIFAVDNQQNEVASIAALNKLGEALFTVSPLKKSL